MKLLKKVEVALLVSVLSSTSLVMTEELPEISEIVEVNEPIQETVVEENIIEQPIEIVEEVQSEVVEEVQMQDAYADSSEQKIKDFIQRIYKNCLGRESDVNGLNYWANQLSSKSKNASSVLEQFLCSEEFEKKGISDSDYIKILYTVCMDRTADQGGIDYWLGQLKNSNRKNILSGFVHSTEFTGVCDTYGIENGTIQKDNVSNDPVVNFVQRFYEKCLGRAGDESGINYWVNGLKNGTFTGQDIANNFMLSDEFKNKNLDNGSFVKVLYTVLMDRNADQGGLDYWVQLLSNGTSKESAINGFIDSQEFTNICSTYGIKKKNTSDADYDTPKLRYNAHYEIKVAEGVYWVPAKVLGESHYTNDQIKDILALEPEKKQELIGTLYEALQLYQIGNFTSAHDNIRIKENGIDWEHHKPGYYAVKSNEGCCATSSNWINYILKDDYEEVGFIAYSQADGSGHILNYIKENDYYYVIDLTHYRMDDFDGSGIETGNLVDYYKRDMIGDNIHKVKKLEDYVKYCIDKFNNPPKVFFTYKANDCLPIDGIRKPGHVTIVYPNTVDVKVLYYNNDTNLDYKFVDPPKQTPEWDNQEEDFKFSNGTITKYIGKKSDVIIHSSINGEKVIGIGVGAFEGCISLTNVKILDGVITIGNDAFCRCSSLKSVEIPNSVTTIGTEAFVFCSKLESLNIPNSVTNIGSEAFSGCSSLKSVEIPNSVTTIGSMVFRNCTNLTSVEIPNSVTEIGSSAFSGCSSLTSIEIPNSVTTIGDGAFKGCNNLTQIKYNGKTYTSVNEFEKAFNNK